MLQIFIFLTWNYFSINNDYL